MCPPTFTPAQKLKSQFFISKFQSSMPKLVSFFNIFDTLSGGHVSFRKNLTGIDIRKKSELILDIFNTRLEGILELVGKARAEPYGSYGSGAIGRIKLEIIGLSDLRNVSHNEWFSSSILSIDCSMSYLISSLNSQLALNISK